MTKKEFISEVAATAGLTNKDADAAVKALVSVITDAVKAGDTVQLTGFGSFSCVEKPERTTRNPRTGEEIKVAACKAPKFKAGKSLKDAVNA